jgi:hypothetical protein
MAKRNIAKILVINKRDKFVKCVSLLCWWSLCDKDTRKLPFHVIIDRMGMTSESSFSSHTRFNFGIDFGTG